MNSGQRTGFSVAAAVIKHTDVTEKYVFAQYVSARREDASSLSHHASSSLHIGEVDA